MIFGLLAACAPAELELTGSCDQVVDAADHAKLKQTGPTNDYFPFDGERRATYIADDVDWDLDVTLLQPIETVNDVDVATFSYARGDDASVLAQVKWASDGDGIRIVASAEAGEDFVTFDPPIQVSSPSNYTYTGHCLETQTGGALYRSTFVGQDDISVPWGVEFEGAVHFSVEGDEGFFLGDYWMVTRYGPIRMDLDGTLWDLADYDWSL